MALVHVGVDRVGQPVDRGGGHEFAAEAGDFLVDGAGGLQEITDESLCEVSAGQSTSVLASHKSITSPCAP